MSPFFLVSYVLLWVLVVVLLVGVFALYHHFGQMYMNTREGREAQGPKEGQALKRVEAADLGGTARILPEPGRPAVIVFGSTDCGLCEKLRPDVLRLARERDDDVQVTAVVAGHPQAVRGWAAELDGAVPVVPDPRSHITAAYGIDALPFVVTVGRDGVVRGGGIVNDHEGLRIAAHEAAMALPVIGHTPTATPQLAKRGEAP